MKREDAQKLVEGFANAYAGITGEEIVYYSLAIPHERFTELRDALKPESTDVFHADSTGEDYERFEYAFSGSILSFLDCGECRG